MIDTGANVSVVRYSSLAAGTGYDISRAMQVRGICDAVERIMGSVTLRLYGGEWGAEHDLQVVRKTCDRCSHDGVLGQDFGR